MLAVPRKKTFPREEGARRSLRHGKSKDTSCRASVTSAPIGYAHFRLRAAARLLAFLTTCLVVRFAADGQ